jgi:enoyl-CoA hydratase/carnithine racemase
VSEVSELRVEDRRGIAVAWIGEQENLIDSELLASLNEALDRIEASGAAGLVTTGHGKFYSNGFDLDHIGKLGERAGAFLTDAVRLLGRVVTLPFPTVAAINGHAFGIGAMLALAHDRRFMRQDRGWLCLPEVALGLRLHPLMNALVATRLGDQTALEALITGRRFDAAAALAGGWIEAAVPEEELVNRAVAAALDWSGQSRDAVAGIKTELYRPILGLLD